MSAFPVVGWTLWGLTIASCIGIIVAGAMFARDKTTCRTGHRELMLLVISGVVGTGAGLVSAVLP